MSHYGPKSKEEEFAHLGTNLQALGLTESRGLKQLIMLFPCGVYLVGRIDC